MIEEAVPKTTYSPREAASSSNRTVTQQTAAELRHLLDQLEDLRISRQRIVDRAKRTASTDDIKPRILRHAAGLTKEQWSDIDPAMFGEVIEEALGKYDGFKDDMEENSVSMDDLLETIKVSKPSDESTLDKSNSCIIIRSKMQSSWNRERLTRR